MTMTEPYREFPHVCSLEISTDRFAGREPAQRSKCIPFATIDTRLQGSYAASRPSQSGVTTIPTDRVLTLSKHHLLGVKLRLASTKGEVDLFGFNRDELAPPIFSVHIMSNAGPDPTSRTGRDCPLPELSVPNHRAYSDAWQNLSLTIWLR